MDTKKTETTDDTMKNNSGEEKTANGVQPDNEGNAGANVEANVGINLGSAIAGQKNFTGIAGGHDIIIEMNLYVKLTLDTKGQVTSADSKVRTATVTTTNQPHRHTRELTYSEVKFGILTLGKSPIGSQLVPGTHITVVKNGRKYRAKVHSTTEGRADGITNMYQLNPKLQPGTKVYLDYDPSTATLKIERV